WAGRSHLTGSLQRESWACTNKRPFTVRANRLCCSLVTFMRKPYLLVLFLYANSRSPSVVGHGSAHDDIEAGVCSISCFFCTHCVWSLGCVSIRSISASC